VLVAPYADSAATLGNDLNAGQTSMEILNNRYQSRIRQSGTILKATMCIDHTDDLQAVYVRIWRQTGGVWNWVGQTENLAPALQASGDGTCPAVTLASPIAGVREGDCYSVMIRKTGTSACLYSHVPAAGNSYSVSDSASSRTNFNWATADAHAFVVPVELSMRAPQVVFIGNSIISGYPQHYSFCNASGASNPATTIEGQFAAMTGLSYQNMGIGGETTDQIAARFDSDVLDLHPRLVIMEGGVNDIWHVASESTFVASWAAMLDAATSRSIRIMALKILPWTHGNSSNMTERDAWNDTLDSLVAGKGTLVDAGPYVGQFRAGGPPGNLWDIQPAFNCGDDTHYDSAGYGQIASVLANHLNEALDADVFAVRIGAAPQAGDTVGDLRIFHYPQGDSTALEWTASRPGFYHVYSTTNSDNDGIPAHGNWTEETVLRVDSRSAYWCDSSAMSGYKNYVVTRDYGSR